MTICPCQNSAHAENLVYTDCCQPFHLGNERPPTAQALMRSRYSAFSLALASYLVDTHHPKNREPNELQSLQDTFKDCEWKQLSIIKTNAGNENDNEGWVEFIAHYEAQGELGTLHENSYFVKEQNQWFYVEGELKDASKKVGRNDPCWCGSGKKFKKCHGP